MSRQGNKLFLKSSKIGKWQERLVFIIIYFCIHRLFKRWVVDNEQGKKGHYFFHNELEMAWKKNHQFRNISFIRKPIGNVILHTLSLHTLKQIHGNSIDF